MKLTFISNYINHHQIPFSEACYRQLEGEYAFVQTMPMESERREMGWSSDGENLPYVHCLYEKEAECRKLIMDSDILMAGWTDREDLILERLKSGRLTIRVSERIYREGRWKAVSPRGLIRKFQEHIRFRNKPVYLLCAGAYVAADFHLIGAYPSKMFRWGYFPATICYNEELWIGKKEQQIVQIVWAGRFISLKRPEYMIKLAIDLKKAGCRFHIHMIGSGELDDQIKALAEIGQVNEQITFTGFCAPEEVRQIMAGSHIHVFTSNHLEGWGAVVNEAMNSGCATVASGQAGAVPYLIEHGHNGMVFDNGDYDQMLSLVKYLIDHPDEREKMGRCAYQTITEQWNAEQAASSLISFARGLQNGEMVPAKAGPLSTAPLL
ncbi:MAG: glycosyltransferase family 4 protein [Lachnospiraceae bacterium]|jgi:glycosyltransferase involved in cell wall biosynthesis|nr:glycosyltransferase family 4 protein [Lachnospiraceae bacterium]